MSSFPLPLVWTAPFAWECAIWDAPLVRDDELIVRAGPRLVALAPANGAVRWNVVLPGADLGGQVLLGAGDVAVCDVMHDRTQYIVAVTRDGVRWKHKLGGTVVRGGATMVDDAFHALVTTRDRSVHLSRIDLATGKERKLSLPARGQRFVRTGADLIVMSPTALEDTPGAYVLGADGTPARVLRTNDVWHGAVSGSNLLTVGTRNRDDFVVELCDLASGNVQWAEPCRGDTAAIDGDDVVHAASGAGGLELVARATANGAVRWRAPLGDVEPAMISIAASVILVRHMTGVVVVDRGGRVRGDASGVEGFVGAVAVDRLYLGGDHALLAAQLPG